jgi:hypothetical protein
LQASCLDGWTKSSKVLGVTIMEKIATVSKASHPSTVTFWGHLLHPLPFRVDREAGNINSAALQMDRWIKEHVVSYQSSQREDLDRKEVGAGQDRKVSPNGSAHVVVTLRSRAAGMPRRRRILPTV